MIKPRAHPRARVRVYCLFDHDHLHFYSLIMIIFIFSKFSKLERNVVKMFTPGTTRAHARGRTDWRSLGGGLLAAASQVTERIKLGPGVGKSSAATTDNRDYRRVRTFPRVTSPLCGRCVVALQERRRHQAMSCGPRTGFAEMLNQETGDVRFCQVLVIGDVRFCQVLVTRNAPVSAILRSRPGAGRRRSYGTARKVGPGHQP